MLPPGVNDKKVAVAVMFQPHRDSGPQNSLPSARPAVAPYQIVTAVSGDGADSDAAWV